MPLTTVTVNALFLRQDGSPEAGARVELALDRHEVDDGFIVPILVSGVTDAGGAISLSVWPNARGGRASVYEVRVYREHYLLLSGSAVFPEADGPLDLHAYLQAGPYPAKISVERFAAEARASASAAALSQAAAEASAAQAQASADLAGGSALTGTAGETMGGHKVVVARGGLLFLADCTSDADAFSVVGITLGAAVAGEPVYYANTGFLQFTGWNWDDNKPVFAGVGGGLAQAQPAGAFSKIVAVPYGPDSLVISLQPTILL